MDTGKRQHLQDIYQTEEVGKDEFTPQVSSRVREERDRAIRRQQITTFMLGSAVLALCVALVYLIVQKSRVDTTASTSPEAIIQKYIPRYSLSAEKQWVLDFDTSYADPTWTGKGDRPFSALWVKKAAFNLILAEQSEGFGKLEEAAEYYENALAILPKVEGVKIPLGMVFFKMKAFDKAIALLEDIPDADLTHEVLNNLGAAYIEAKAFDKAEEALNKSLEKKPAYAEALKNKAILYQEEKKTDQAIAYYEQYLDQRPNDVDTRQQLALYLTENANWKLAAEQLEILTQSVTDVANYYLLLARAHNKLGNTDQSIAAIRRAIQLTDPSLALAWMDDAEFDQLRKSKDFRILMESLQKTN